MLVEHVEHVGTQAALMWSNLVDADSSRNNDDDGRTYRTKASLVD